jgi:hypothetical protein
MSLKSGMYHQLFSFQSWIVTALKADGTYLISVTLLFSKSSKANLAASKAG